ncbi:MAG: FecR domain-containing protein [Ramlibacter sp.]
MLCALCVAVPGLASAQASIGTVKRIEGQPTLVSASGERPARVGSAVYEGDRVATRAGAALGITLMDGTQLAVGPNSAVTVQTFRFDTTTREGALLVDIARGALRMVSGLIARQDPQAVAINTPTATIGIRGTDFLVDVGNPPVQ